MANAIYKVSPSGKKIADELTKWKVKTPTKPVQAPSKVITVVNKAKPKTTDKEQNHSHFISY